jgi:uncharacterized phage protein gp47/JayE
MSYGVTTAGFIRKPFAIIQAETQELFRTTLGLGSRFDFSENTHVGRLVSVMADREAALWEAMEAVYASQYPDTATGASLVFLAALTGTLQEPARFSTVALTCTGTPGTIIPAGRVVAIPGTETTFETLVDATIGGGGNVSVQAQCQVLGPVEALAGSLTEIRTAVFGWASVTNPLDAVKGANLETDESLRRRREEELRAVGSASVAAIRSAVLQVDGVTAVRIFENSTDDTDADGVPPHSFELVVLGGVDADIAQAIWDTKAAGIGTYGTTTVAVLDVEGTPHDVRFSRPVEVPMTFVLTAAISSSFPGDGAAQIKSAIINRGELLAIGQDVPFTAFYPPIHGVTGVEYVPSLTINGGTANLSITSRQIATFDASLITVNTTAAVDT